MEQLNINIVKNSSYTLDEIFNIYKEAFPTNEQWVEILKIREGVLNFFSLKDILIKAVSHYDKSIYVNSFYYQNKQYWLDKDIRMGLFRLIDSGAQNITLQLGETYININADQLKNFLNQLEVYAGKCFSSTAKHLSELKQVQKLEDLVNYDYTTGYPDKITLNEN